MSAKNIIGIVVIVGCLGAAGIIFSGKFTQRAQLDQQNALQEQRLAQSYAFVDALPLKSELQGRVRRWVPVAHERSFTDSYDGTANPPLDETLYMYTFVRELLASAIHDEDATLIRYFQNVVGQYPEPPALD